ncbi:MAG TPA: epoxyqueuosine reductase QueH [Syntrophorhabdaceae bacterium]|nr:epoxyqueuosine reductase QueH [Syntrophorhabdaceae bacterium]HQE80867.1 epoxyqueuosine reductase QueH [Syntrophorhabdaceae bacterium]HQK46270.1 epoxyqueuosine reductase QueH [Syntrophorhabdaceae bacterium]HRR71526.1 epoxyqueuosine reductase QueH [Syntrophorhabdaceae bacterium]
MRVLLHICCAPCCVYTLKTLRKEGMEVTGYFFNPNIHPYTEFTKRLKTLDNYAKISLLPLIVHNDYNLVDFLKGAIDYGRDRCLFCYKIRLEKTFEVALKEGFEAVTTTLLYSKYQRHDDIREIGMDFSQRFGISFLYMDFRVGWRQGIEESKGLNMYRQNYCGCIFSEYERFAGRQR